MKLLTKAAKPRTGLKRTRLSIFALTFLLSLFYQNLSHASGAARPDLGDEVITDGGGTTTPQTPTTPNTPTTPTTPSNPSNPTNPNPPGTYGSDFSSPWARSETQIVIDAYEGNSIEWDKMATDKRTVGVIHRSSIGSRVDTMYVSRKKIALQRGYLWGAYHLGLPGNTIAQADLFLSLVKDEPNTLMILDLEDTGNGKFMTIDEAVVFMERVYDKTGYIPTVYANQATIIALNSKVKNNPRFQQAKLWYARFKSTVTDFPKGIWNGYFLWQFSSELNCTTTGSCLYNVPGTKADMDVNVFDGTKAELEANWNNH